jgi:peptidoglycan biosynthesis protein MviN/MurJ (putative lipid II flippase)
MNALRWIVLIAVAGSIPGGVVAFTLGLAFFTLATGVGARPVAWAMVPHLSRLHQIGDHRAFQLHWGQGLSMSISVIAPAIAGIYALSSALPQAVSYGEMAGDTGTALVLAAMLPLTAAILGETVFIHASHGSYARSDARGPLMAMALRTFLTLMGLGIAVWAAEGRAILVVMGSTVAIADLLSGGFLGMRILRKSEGVVAEIGAGAGRAFLASGIMALPIYLLSSRLMRDGLEQIGAVLLVAICAAAGAGIYVAIQHTRLRTPGFGLLARQARAVFRRTAP